MLLLIHFTGVRDLSISSGMRHFHQYYVCMPQLVVISEPPILVGPYSRYRDGTLLSYLWARGLPGRSKAYLLRVSRTYPSLPAAHEDAEAADCRRRFHPWARYPI